MHGDSIIIHIFYWWKPYSTTKSWCLMSNRRTLRKKTRSLCLMNKKRRYRMYLLSSWPCPIKISVIVVVVSRIGSSLAISRISNRALPSQPLPSFKTLVTSVGKANANAKASVTYRECPKIGPHFSLNCQRMLRLISSLKNRESWQESTYRRV